MAHRTAVSLILVALILPVAVPFAFDAEASSGTPTYTTYAGPAESSTFTVFIDSGGEPSLGVDWTTNEVLYQHGFRTFRVGLDANGASMWTDVSPLTTPFNVDPMLYTDPLTGRTWAGGLDGLCSSMGISDDGGRSWIPAGNMCVPTLDHQTIASGPWSLPLPQGVLYPRATYYCAQASGVTCILSADGGLTWGTPVPVSCQFVNPGFHGSVHIGPDGKVFLPFRNCGGGAGVSVSTDNGLTWTGRKVPGSEHNGHGFDPDVATTPSGWLYLGYANGTDGRSMATMSKNNGTTWSTPVDIGAPLGIRTSTFHEVVAGDDDRAAIAFLGTADAGDPWEASFTGVWELYIATTYDAGATWTTVKASTDPVQRGWICDGGAGCDTGNAGHRNLLDFMDAQVDAQGRILVGYADGCIDVCAGPTGTSAMSFASRATITRQSGGLTLFSAFDPSNGALFVSGHGPYVTTPGNGVTVSGIAANGVAPYTYTWSVLTRPEGSGADATAFTSSTGAAPVFTPDLIGAYDLRLEARDSAGGVAVDVVTVSAVSASGTAIPACSIGVATDVAGDSTALDGIGRRDLVGVLASEAASTWTLCAKVADMNDAGTSGSKYTFFWDAGYEAPVITYSATATLSATGVLSAVQSFKGVNAAGASLTLAQLGGPAAATVVGDTLRITLPRSSIGSPAAGDIATNIFARIDNTVTPATTWDRAPQTAGASYTFGHLLADPTPPSTVASLTATDATTGGQVNLSWSTATDNIAIQDYVVRRSTIAGGPYRTHAVTAAVDLVDTTVTDGTTYYYVVAARDGAGNVGGFSPEASVTPTGPGGPGGDLTPPSIPASLALDAVTSSSALLVWDASTDAESGISHYNVKRDGSLVGAPTVATFLDQGLAPATSYTYDVSAVNGDGLESASVSIVVLTSARPPDCGQVAAPFELAADPIGDATRADGRADIVRVGLRETPTRLWFHIGVDNLTNAAPNTMFRVAFQVDADHGYAMYVRATDGGAQPAGLFLTTGLVEVPLQKQPSVAFQCSSVLLGVQKADLTTAGTTYQNVQVSSSVDSTSPPVSGVYDRAPDNGGVDYTLGDGL